jgi:hypothetical protein
MKIRRFVRNTRGSAAIPVAVIMAMIVVVSLVQNIFIWEQTITAADRIRMNEHIDIDTINIADGQIDLKVTNTGEEIAHVVAIWINQTRYPVDWYLNSGESKSDIGLELTLSSPLHNASEQLISVITARGNAAHETYYPPSPENPPPWWQESGYPLVVLPAESAVDPITNTLSLAVWNRFDSAIEVDLLICTRVDVAGTSSSKVLVVPVDWLIESENRGYIEAVLENAVISGNGLRIELVSSHNWVVGAYVFLYP